MNDMMMQHAGVRRELGVTVTEEQLRDIELIRNKVMCASQACSPAAVPAGVSNEDLNRFVLAAVNAKAVATTLESGWWREIGKRYKLPTGQNTWIDFGTGELYVMDPLA